MLEATFDLYPTMEASALGEALEQATKQLRKRSLLVVVTNRRDEDARWEAQLVHRLRARHLVVAAMLREGCVDRILEAPATTAEDALLQAATHDFLWRRQRSLATLRAAGLDLLDVTPASLPAALVNYYLRTKARGAL